MTRSIFGKLLLSHVTVILVSVLTLGPLMSYLVRDYVVETKRLDLLAKGSTALTMVSPLLADGQMPADAFLDAMGDMAGGEIWLMDNSGQVIAGQLPKRLTERRRNNLLDLWETADWQDSGGTQIMLKPRRSGDPAIIAALPLPQYSTNPPTALFLYAPVTGVARTALALEKLLMYALAAGILAAALAGLIMARSLTRPLSDISRSATAFAGGDYTSRTTATQTDEVGELGRTFNNMADQLAQAEQNRRDFLSNVSHELKTPVASIQALTEAMLDGLVTSDEHRQRYLISIVDATRRIARLIGDLLDLSQLEAGELTIIREQLDLSAHFAAQRDKLLPFLTTKGLTINFNLPLTLPPVYADRDRLGQILANLLTNAIRHASPGSSITLAARSLSIKQIAIDVTNHGPGIPPEHLSHIWERFYRADKSRARIDGGTGLGLAITKKLVEAMGGAITATSLPGETTTFTFTLPTA